MEIRAELVIRASADDTWVVVGEGFGQIGEWASAITASAMDGPPAVGQVRTCQIARFGPVAAGVIEERLLRFDPATRSLSYEATHGLPGFITRAVSHWSVIPGPDATASCAVKIHAVLTLRPAMRPLGPVLRWRMRGDSRQTLDELRQRVEAGRPHASTLP